jgi:signal recognition particle receptor subunit beta
VEVLPTLGFAIESITSPSGRKVLVYDCAGGYRYRSMWDYFVSECDGVIYVIDAADRDRLSLVKTNIDEFLRHPHLKRKPIVFIANKQDLQDALKKEEIKRLLSLDKKSIGNPFSIKPGSGISGMGLNDAIAFIEDNAATLLP